MALDWSDRLPLENCLVFDRPKIFQNCLLLKQLKMDIFTPKCMHKKSQDPSYSSLKTMWGAIELCNKELTRWEGGHHAHLPMRKFFFCLGVKVLVLSIRAFRRVSPQLCCLDCRGSTSVFRWQQHYSSRGCSSYFSSFQWSYEENRRMQPTQERAEML